MDDAFNPAADYEQRGYLNCDFKLFCLDENRALYTPWHYHDFDKIVFFLRGNASYSVEGRSYELRPYDLIIVPHHSIHRTFADDERNYERYVLYLRPDILSRLSSMELFEPDRDQEGGTDICDIFELPSEKKSNLVHFDAGGTALIMEDFTELKRLMEMDKGPGSSIRIHMGLIKLMLDLSDLCAAQEDAFMEKAHYNRKIVDIIDHINDNLSGDLSIDSIADRFYISKYHMMRLFKAETGFSVHQYITQKRVLRARDLIVRGEGAMTAAMEAGFHDYSAFCSAFQKLTGKLPSDYSWG
ncbi:AraC family transcriptional regulator [Butyrivibrio sp. MC2013]|uniref:AraC family transcriptional regulator n=1 Tax=Butyrivibrio sp. MC2013 TaxID=1280686 RepID=UPI0003FA970D|nr:AraC family transcriptional regulator [Butyrivibrio sp. MC2013]